MRTPPITMKDDLTITKVDEYSAVIKKNTSPIGGYMVALVMPEGVRPWLRRTDHTWHQTRLGAHLWLRRTVRRHARGKA